MSSTSDVAPPATAQPPADAERPAPEPSSASFARWPPDNVAVVAMDAGEPCGDDGACQWEYQARMGQYTVVIDSSLYMSEGEFFATIDRVIAQLGNELS